jgi:predicted sugar kinase
MRVLPGAASGDFAAFAEGVTVLQQRLGAHFAPAQEGRAFASADVGRAIEALGRLAGGAAGAAVGQSSWGPTGFAILPSQERADELIEALRTRQLLHPALELRVVRARDHGAELFSPAVDDPA